VEVMANFTFSGHLNPGK